MRISFLDYNFRVEETKINILCNIDENFAPSLTVMLSSVLANTPKTTFEVFVLHVGLSENTRLRIESSFSSSTLKIHFIEISLREFSQYLPENWRGKEIINARLFATEFVPINIDRVLYLDSDLLVLDDLNKIWNIPLKDNLLGAVPDQAPNIRFRKVKSSARADGSDAEKFYFNSGVMLINLKLWRKINFGETLRNFFFANHVSLEFPDQDTLNGCVENRWEILSDRWNLLEPTFYSQGRKLLNLSRKEYLELISFPGIVHFTGDSKPWISKSDHPYKKLFYYYLSQTQWHDWHANEKKTLASQFELLKRKCKTLLLIRPWLFRDLTLRYRKETKT